MQKQKKADSKPAKPTKAAAKRKSAPVSKAAPPRARPRVAKVEAVSENEVRQKAYSLWESRGCPFGSPEVDWYRAKEQLGAGKAI